MRGQSVTLYERQKIELHLRGMASIRDVAKMLFRDHSVTVCELQQNTCRDGTYRATKADEYAEKRKHRIRKRS